MPDNRNLFSGKRKYLLGLVLLLFISVIGVAFSMTGSDDFDIARREVLLCRIGHEILLQSGDSASRVLPVEKIAGNEYQIRFENDLTFQPDSLVVGRSLDMFISKLRKKLEFDPNIKIVVIRGKGYKLEVSS